MVMSMAAMLGAAPCGRFSNHRTLTWEQVDLNEKAPTGGAFAEPSDGLERRPLLTIEQRGGTCGQGRGVAGTKAAQEEGSAEHG
jgi:hypothetical protein